MKSPSRGSGDLPIILFEQPQAWKAAITSLSYAEALDAALCYGWIDSQKKSYDEASWLQKFTRRGPESIWSKINREKVQALGETGRMKPNGLVAVERARKDGRWAAAYDSQRTASVPADLEAKLDDNPTAQASFSALDSANTYSILFRIQTAKKPETRAKRIVALVAMLEKKEKIHP